MADNYQGLREPITYSVQTLVQEGRKKRYGAIEITALEVSEKIVKGEANSREEALRQILTEKGFQIKIPQIKKATQEFNRQYNLWEKSLEISR